MPRSILSDKAKAAFDALCGVTRVTVGARRRVDPALFASLSRNCPYDGMESVCWPLA